jgi:hypothetical protein
MYAFVAIWLSSGTVRLCTNQMQCPLCNETKSRRGWRPCQWKANDPYNGEFLGCKKCQEDGVYIAQPFIQAELQELIVSLRKLVPSKAVCLRWSEFADVYITEVPVCTRKTWSHSGGLLCVRHRDPVHWVDATNGYSYFDPGNYIYARAFFLMVPTSFYNEETMGDFFESCLGLALLKANLNCDDDASRFQLSFARWIRKFVWTLYSIERLAGNSGNLGPRAWAQNCHSFWDNA